jgi:ADP-ribose pyrophosphatase
MAVKSAWTTLAEQVLLDRQPFVRVTQERVRTDSGIEIDDYYRVVLPKFASCVPVTQDGMIVTLWQYKHGPKAYSLTFPAGFIEPGEAPDSACRRELLEETGYIAVALAPLGDFVDGGNQPGSHGYYFIATGCSPVQAPEDGDLETMEIRLMTPAEVDAALDAGQFAICHHVTAWLLASRVLNSIAR